MNEVFYLLIVLEVLLGSYSLWEGVRWLRMARLRLGAHPGFYVPRVALICPVKGREVRLEENLTALTTFEYPYYEVFFTLASADDPAYEVVRRVVRGSKRPTHVVLAGPPEGCGEKVNNLRV